MFLSHRRTNDFFGLAHVLLEGRFNCFTEATSMPVNTAREPTFFPHESSAAALPSSGTAGPCCKTYMFCVRHAVLSLAILPGTALNFTPIDPIKALFWRAVINGVIAVPFMITIMLLAMKSEVMGRFVIRWRLRALGWLATAVMTLAVFTMFAMLRLD